MRRAWLAGTAALILVITGCGSGNRGSAGPVPTTTGPAAGSGSTISVPAVLTVGMEGGRDAVPWAQVGAGWFLAEWAPSTTPATTDSPGTVLYLVDPLGGRYRIASGAGVPSGAFAAWSGDGKRALFVTSPDTAPAYTLLDLTTGQTTPVTLPIDGAHAGPVDFTKPHGLGIVTSGWYQSSPATVTPVERFDLTGKQQASYPPEGFPPPAGSVAPPRGTIDFLYTPDGTRMLQTAELALQLTGNGGLPIRSIPDPAGTTACRPLSWWAADEALLSCATPTGTTLWLQPVNGDPPTQLATEGADSQQAWQLTSGIFASDPRCIGSACTGIGQLSSDGTSVTPVPVTGRGPGQSVTVIGASPSRLAILGRQDSTNPGFLEWLEPDNGTASTLLGGTVNGGSVTAAIAQPQPLPTTSPSPPPATSPHFNSPEAAMTYLVSAWNRGDQSELDFVTNPPAQAALAAMHSEAVDLRLDHCTPRPTGDYICYFNHGYPAGYTQTTEPGGVGHSQFIVGPAATPGWYMTVFETCG